MENLKFNENGLIPAVVRDYETGQVLTLAYMNRESLDITLKEGRTCFWSRSRKELWRKGETSGHIQRVCSITADCDRDALLVTVKQTGAACHTGEFSCFHNTLYGAEKTPFSLDTLFRLIGDRKSNPKEGSYTNYLFDKGLDKILKKVGEECTEVVIAAKNDDAELVYELADLAYHALVLMCERGISPERVGHELAKRHVVDAKVKQEAVKVDE